VDALRTLDRARRVLVEHAGVEPGGDLRRLEQAILEQDSGLAGGVPPVDPATSCPYLGLLPYDVADAEAFFGRDRDLAHCLEVLAASGALVVVGPSGSGKSSLVRAGVVAALQRLGDAVTVIVPGAEPMRAMEQAQDRQGPIVVDQCEEVVTAGADAVERERFLTALADRARCARVIVTLRADRIGDLTGHRGFAGLVERSLVLVGTPGEDDMRAIISGPAGQAGLLLEPGLGDLLIREVEGEPGALPLLSHVLRATWGAP
jgi:hypothetical protein